MSGGIFGFGDYGLKEGHDGDSSAWQLLLRALFTSCSRL